MLRWSAEETGRQIDFAAIVTPDVPLGIPGGSELIALGRAAAGRTIDASPVQAVAVVLGPTAAVRAAAVAGAFELYNRIVDATGLPVGRVQREVLSDIIATLGLKRFPHAEHGL